VEISNPRQALILVYDFHAWPSACVSDVEIHELEKQRVYSLHHQDSAYEANAIHAKNWPSSETETYGLAGKIGVPSCQ